VAPEIARKLKGKRAELQTWLDRARLGNEQSFRIGEVEFEAIRRALSPITENYLRKLLRESGVPLAPMVEGVRQGTFEELAESLTKLTIEYERRDPAARAAVRSLVITAKDHARWAAKDPAKRVAKEEMALWLLTWLENPPLFPEWVRLRVALLQDPGL